MGRHSLSRAHQECLASGVLTLLADVQTNLVSKLDQNAIFFFF